MSTSSVLTVVGYAVGAYFGPVGSTLWASAGGMIGPCVGSATDAPHPIEQNLKADLDNFKQGGNHVAAQFLD
jgi:hypothetical protein